MPTAGVKMTGPLFTGETQRAVLRALADTATQGATLGQRYVRDIDDDTFRHPTGVARSRVRVTQSSPFRWFVHRSYLIYRFWLEDGGTRSRWFSGYHAFERATPRLQRDIVKLAEVLIRRAVG